MRILKTALGVVALVLSVLVPARGYAAESLRADWLCDTTNRAVAMGRKMTGWTWNLRAAMRHIGRSLGPALACQRGALNIRMIPLETVNRSTADQTIELEPNVATERLDCVLAGSMTVVGAGGLGVVFPDASERLVPRIRILKDNLPIWDSDLRGTYQDYLGSVGNAAARDDLTTAEVAVAGTYAFRLPFSILFNSAYLRNPYDTHLPALPVRTSLRMVVTWGTTRQSATSDPGTGEMLSAGGDAYTWAVEPTLTVTQISSPRAGIKPWGIPIFTSFDMPAWAAATARLVGRFDNDRRFIRLILGNFYGPTLLLEDAINTLSLEAVGQPWIQDVPILTLRDQDQSDHPAIGAGTAGWTRLDFTNGGWIGGAVNPKAHTDLKLVADVATPTAGNGLIRVYQKQIFGLEGFTNLPGE